MTTGQQVDAEPSRSRRGDATLAAPPSPADPPIGNLKSAQAPRPTAQQIRTIRKAPRPQQHPASIKRPLAKSTTPAMLDTAKPADDVSRPLNPPEARGAIAAGQRSAAVDDAVAVGTTNFELPGFGLSLVSRQAVEAIAALDFKPLTASVQASLKASVLPSLQAMAAATKVTFPTTYGSAGLASTYQLAGSVLQADEAVRNAAARLHKLTVSSIQPTIPSGPLGETAMRLLDRDALLLMPDDIMGNRASYADPETEREIRARIRWLGLGLLLIPGIPTALGVALLILANEPLANIIGVVLGGVGLLVNVPQAWVTLRELTGQGRR